MADLGHIFVAAIGLGASGEAIRRYRAFKQRRREMPYADRNAGFWTDKRLYLSEAAFSALAAALPFTAIIGMTSAGRPIWVMYIGLLAYAFFIFLMMRALNMREPQ